MARLPGRSGRGGSGRDGIIQGLALLGRFRKDGFARFEASAQGFLASLAPWIAFLLVGGVLLAFEGKPLEAATDVAVVTCWLLVPSVVSQLVASAFRRDQRWLRYATATTWCEWLMLPVYAAALLAASICMAAGLPPHVAAFVLLGVMGIYWLCLHVFLARSGLDLSPARAVVLVVAVIATDTALFAAGHAVGGPASGFFGV